MSNELAHPHGAPCWFELISHHEPKARAFYSALFGWSSEDRQLEDGSRYVVAKLGNEYVAAMYAMDPELQEQGVPSHWVVYFAVDDIHAAIDTAIEEGGELLVEPYQVTDMGLTAILSDPEGASFCLWQTGSHPGAGLIGAPGSVTWAELASRDPADAGDFYSRTLGWSVRHLPLSETGAYTTFGSEDEDWGGMLTMDEQWQDIPPHWVLYFAVEDADSASEQADELGGSVIVPPFDVPEVGRLAMLADPSGAAFYVMQRYNS